MKRVKLPSLSYLHELFSYDPETGVLTHKQARTKGKTAYRYRVGDKAGYHNNFGYLVVSVDNRPYSVHRIIWKMQTGQEPPDYMDHINRIRDDNRWANLREATAEQNAWNSRHFSASGLKGVTVDPVGGTWNATVQTNGKSKFLGSFPSATAAVAAYETEVRATRGEFALADDLLVECQVMTLVDDALHERLSDIRAKVSQLRSSAERADQMKFAKALDEIWVELAKIDKAARPTHDLVRTLTPKPRYETA